jgi:hypothetical protein
MDEALGAARDAAGRGEVPVGAAVVKDGKLLALEIMADSAPGKATLAAAELVVDVQEGLADVIPDIANATLDVVRGLGGAIVDGLDGAYDAAAAKLEGREPDVVAGIVVVSLTILTALYFQPLISHPEPEKPASMRCSRLAFR